MKHRLSIITAIFVHICSFDKVSLASRYNDGEELIVYDLKRVSSGLEVNAMKDASFDCWLNALHNLEYSSINQENNLIDNSAESKLLSPGGSFCNTIKSGNQLDILAFELTKCEYERFSTVPLPLSCSLKGPHLHGTSNEVLLRECMSSLSTETWLGVWSAFTQYKISSYNICTKLTEDLTLHRQKVTSYQLEKTITDMEDKLDHILSRANNQIEETIYSMESKIENMRSDMDDDLKHIINKEISSVQQLNEEMKTTIEKADGKLEETARKIDEHFQNVFVEKYQNSGLSTLTDIYLKVKSISAVIACRWKDFGMITRSIFHLIIIVLFTNASGLKKARFKMIILALVELVISLNLDQLAVLGQMDYTTTQTFISSIRCSVQILYGTIITFTLFRSFYTDKNENNKNDNKVTTSIPTDDSRSYNHCISQQINTVLDQMKIQLEIDKEQRRNEQDQWQQMMMRYIQDKDQYQKELNYLRSSSGHYFETPTLDLPFSSPMLQRYTNRSTSYHSNRGGANLESTRQQINFTSEVGNNIGNVDSQNNDQSHLSQIVEDKDSVEASLNGRDGNETIQFWTPSPSPIYNNSSSEEDACNEFDRNLQMRFIKPTNIVTVEKKLHEKKRKMDESNNEIHISSDDQKEIKKQKQSL